MTRRKHSADSKSYPDIPDDKPILTGGPATEAVPGLHEDPLDPLSPREHTRAAPLPGDEDDGGESVLSGRPRETGGERPDNH